ncbi:MAG: hypothetical protein ACK4GA_03010 [Acinetobacter sp.]|uniref:hypothetical protein n=1 Tax=Acinetobacter sp. TaxID=472 RepID=UPI00391D4B70
MAEQNNNEVMIQLPWTVPQQPLVQTTSMVENPNKKMELNLTHSTDTTAISSFALSVIIALILGSLATWLAYWYGRKSFDLTKQSFDSLIEQIKSSEKITLTTNQELIKSQESQKKFELSFQRKEADRAEFRKLSFEYISTVKLTLKFLLIKLSNIEDESWAYLVENSYDKFFDTFNEQLDEDFNKLGAISLHLFLILNNKSKNHYQFSEKIELINRLVLSILCTLESKAETKEKTEDLAKKINDLLIFMTGIIHSDESFN